MSIGKITYFIFNVFFFWLDSDSNIFIVSIQRLSWNKKKTAELNEMKEEFFIKHVKREGKIVSSWVEKEKQISKRRKKL